MKDMKNWLRAVLANDRTTLRELIEDGADLDANDADGRTLMMHAALAGNHEVVELLALNGFDVNAQDKNGSSSLHFAAQDFHVAVADTLLRMGAQVNIRDRYGNTPLWTAVFNSRGRGELIALLLEHGADRLNQNNSGRTPLDLANTIGNYDVKQFLT